MAPEPNVTLKEEHCLQPITTLYFFLKRTSRKILIIVIWDIEMLMFMGRTDLHKPVIKVVVDVL